MKYSEFMKKYANHPNYKSPEGTEISAQSWETEAPLRMLLNNLNPEVAEDSENLVVYGGTGQAARDKDSVRKIIKALMELKIDQSLLIQSGKPVGIVRSHPEAPRVLIANSNLVPHWATWDHFNRLKEKGLMMYGQMTAGSWIYIGTQGILQGTYETFAACGEKYFNGDLKGKLLVTGGLGAMGGAQPLAAAMAGAAFLGVDVNPESIKKRIKTKYIDRMTHSYEEAKKMVLEAKNQKKALSVGLVGNIGDVLEKLLKDKIIPDVLTDQTSAHDPVHGYVPAGISFEKAKLLRKSNPDEYRERALKSMARHVGLMLKMQKQGSRVFDYGNNLREFAKQGGEKNAFSYPGFVPEYIRPQFCEGKGPFRWAALSGDPQDIHETDQALIETFPENKKMINWIQQAQKKVAFQGLPCRICWLGLGEREKAGKLFNELVRSGRLKAPVVIGRDHLDGGSVASPYRETESMKDGTDAVSDWPLLNLMANTCGGATWVSFHHGGGVGIGYSQHAGMVLLVDGSEKSKRRIKRVLHNDPATAIFRHADAGYEKALEFANKFDLNQFK